MLMATNLLSPLMTKFLSLLLLVLYPFLLLDAQSPPDKTPAFPSREVRSSFLLGAGYVHLFDAYLSPLDYTGNSLSLSHLRERQVGWWKKQWQWQNLTQLHLAQTLNPAQTAQLYDFDFSTAWALHRRLLTSPNWQLSLGPQFGAHLGGSYAPRNGNNPGQARMALDLSLSLRSDHRFRLFRNTWIWRNQLDAPLLGLMFSPQFGQSYYELFGLGHSHRNLVGTTPFNAPSLRLLSTLSLPFARGRFSIGLHSHIRQSHAHHLGRHAWHHQLLLGYTRTFQYID